MMACSGMVYCLLLLLQILAVQSVVQNVTRNEDGDTFTNPDDKCDPNSCWDYNVINVGGGTMPTDNCKCFCYSDNTFVVHNTTCVPNNKVHSNLLASLRAKDALFRVPKSSGCHPSIKVMPVLDITRPGSRKLCLAGTYITKCNIMKKDSKYFYEGKWYPIWPTNRKQDIFNITEDDKDSFLKWKSLGQQFTGLIFGLKISCHLKHSLADDMTNAFGSYLIFKSVGSHYFNGDKPTFAPISSAPTSEANRPSTTSQSSTTASKSDKGKNSSSSEDKGLIAGVTICVILVLIVIIVVVVFYLRRKRNSNGKPPEEAKSEANPTYELGQDRTLPVTVNGKTPDYDYPDTSNRYQPLVQNTRTRDASGKVPVYTPLNQETKNNNPRPVLHMKTPDKHGLAYETVAIPIQQPATNEPDLAESPDYEDPTNPRNPNEGKYLAESPDYEDPTNPRNPNEGGLYAVSTAQDGNTIDFENTAYRDPDSVIPIG